MGTTECRKEGSAAKIYSTARREDERERGNSSSSDTPTNNSRRVFWHPITEGGRMKQRSKVNYAVRRSISGACRSLPSLSLSFVRACECVSVQCPICAWLGVRATASLCPGVILDCAARVRAYLRACVRASRTHRTAPAAGKRGFCALLANPFSLLFLTFPSKFMAGQPW